MLAHSDAANASSAYVRPRHLSPVTPSTRPTSPAPTAIGYFATMRAIRSSARLTSTERLVLLMIASHADNATGEACPGIPKLAAECGLTTRTIERTIAALVASGWLVRRSAASAWGTNLYTIRPVPNDVRPTSPRRYGRPFDRVPPDTGSPPPPSRVQVPPDTGSSTLPLPLHGETALCVALTAEHEAPESTHTEVFEVDQEHEHEAPAAELAAVAVELHAGDQEHEAPVYRVASRSAEPTAAAAGVASRSAEPTAAEQEVLAALASHSELRALVRPPIAATLAAEGRPLPVVRRALGELAEHARDAAAAGEPWSAATLARKARAYVRRAWADPDRPAPVTPAIAEHEAPVVPPRLSATVGHLRGLIAALGAGNGRRSEA